MLKNITHAFLSVFDQDEALDFYVNKLGMVPNTDVDMGVMRWLTVSPSTQPDMQLVLMKPGAPAHSPELAEEIRSVVSKGGGGSVIFATDDCRATYEDLKAKGVEFTQEPVEQPYGIDCGIRDPFGNHLRFTQVLVPAS